MYKCEISKFQNANKMPTISVCYALQSVPENINIKKNISPLHHQGDTIETIPFI
jgi:hypothetical protein